MKWRSIVGIWPESPPSHRVTAVVAVDNPPSLFTGADDGVIISWHLSDEKIKPVAMLCGHAASIVDLCVCCPLLAPPYNNADHLGDTEVSNGPANQDALLSACSDGMLCVWSTGNGHCRRKRQLPPWVGSPSMVQTLPGNRRFVCVASCFMDGAHTIDHESNDSAEGSEAAGEQEPILRKPSKCTVVIVDSYTLTIVQTVFHGSLSIGPLKFMTVVESVDEKEKHSALMVDSYGKLQHIPLVKEDNVDKDGGNKLHVDSSVVNTTALENGAYEGGLVVSVAVCGQMLGLVYKTRCVFVLAASANVIGVVSFNDNAHCSGAASTLAHVAGSMFISSDDACTLKSGKICNTIAGKFSVWNDRGFAVIYEISYVDGTFKSDIVCEIPAISCPMDVQLSTNFAQLSNCIIRVSSICFHDEEPLLWSPYLTTWSLHQMVEDHMVFGKRCRLLGKGNLLTDWIHESSYALRSEASERDSWEESSSRDDDLTSTCTFPSQNIFSTSSKDDLKYNGRQGGRIVTSTIVISQSAHIPYAVVYGYHSGEIELVPFKRLTQEVDSDGVNVHPDIEPQGHKQHFSGHTGAVLCLAAHCVIGTSSGRTSRVLLSGSMDCTLRLWDLDTCKPIMVMHHHVAPVRQIILPPVQSDRPWNDCFLSVGEDFCVALVSLETLRVERMFPGHPSYPAKVVWDSVRGYLACLSQNYSVAAGAKDALYIWDIKSGSRERVLRGAAAHSMFNNFCKGIDTTNVFGCPSNYNVSSSSLHLPMSGDGDLLLSQSKINQSSSSAKANLSEHSMSSWGNSSSRERSLNQRQGDFDKLPIRCSCPISGITVLGFELSSLVSLYGLGDDTSKEWNGTANDSQTVVTGSNQGSTAVDSSVQDESSDIMERHQCIDNKLSLLRFSLSFLHFWGIDSEVDNFLMMEMNVRRFEKVILAPGLEGDRGCITLAFPAFSSVLQLWKSSSEFCALRSLTMVSLAQSMVNLRPSCSGASSALSAFYTRNFAEKNPGMKPPSLQLLVSFWQDEDEHIRMAARTLFHCAASRAIPPALCCPRSTGLVTAPNSAEQEERGDKLEDANNREATANPSHVGMPPDIQRTSHNREAEILKWLESYELQDWMSCVGGTSQDAMASHIIVAAALAIWYPSLVKPKLAMLTVHPLMKLVMATNEKYSSTAAELLAEGMDSTWKECISPEIPRMIGDIFFQIECVSGASVNTSPVAPLVPPKIRDTLVSVLLPSLALADIPGFLGVIESLIWSTASDSPVHLVSLKTLIRLTRGAPRILAQYLHKVVNFILQTMDPANSVMRKTCLQSSMATLREVVRVYPMVAMNDSSTRLAVGDAIAEVNSANIYVYDMQSVTKIKVLDASGPPGLPTLLSGAPETIITAISALSFTPDGEGLVAFSEHGLIIRWWSLGTAWWEKLSRNFVPVQCTKLILVPPWEGFSPNSSRASIIANIAGNGGQETPQEYIRSSDVDGLNRLLYNLDLSYRLEWVGERKVLLTRHQQEMGSFLL